MNPFKGDYFYGTGRCKTAVARMCIYANGDGSITVNGKNVQNYFGQSAKNVLIS